MRDILTLLQELDNIYGIDTLEVYEQRWQEGEGQIQALFPGFTLALLKYPMQDRSVPHMGE